MTTQPQKILFVLIFIFFLPLTVQAQTPASEPGNLEEITESVKERLQSVVRDRSSLGLSGIPVAYMGILQSVSGNTLSLLTDDGLKLASISATTSYQKPPAKKSVTLDDVPIDSYVTAIGTAKTEAVLDTQAVLIQDTPPASPSTAIAYGTVVAYDTKDFQLELIPSQGEPQTFLVSRKATLNRWVPDGTKEAFTRTTPLDPGTPVLVIFTPGEGPNAENLVNDLLLKST